MVFSSLPLYLDPPNWQQHSNDHPHHHHQQQLQGSVGEINENTHHLVVPTQSVPQPPQHVVQPHRVGLGGTPIRPNSMAEQARMNKIPQPEIPLNCPRCDSTNTKFCYYNNYSLTQPRHFCKACRRYWTRGGALRNVPVGGGCRRNKRTSSKSSGGGGGGCGGGSSSSSKSSLSSPTTATIGGVGHMDIISSTVMGPSIPSSGGGMTSFMASLANMGMANLGLTFGGMHAPPLSVGGLNQHQQHQMDYNNEHMMMSHQQAHHHHHQPQFPNNLLGGFEVGGGSLYSTTMQGGGDDDNDDDHDNNHHHHVNNVNMNNANHVLNKNNCSSSAAMMMSQLAPVKMEDGTQRLNLAKQLMMGITSSSSNNPTIGNDGGGNQYWGCPISNGNTTGATTNMWTDLSGLNSSSTSHLI